MSKIYLVFLAVFIFQLTFSQESVPYNSYYDSGELKTNGQLLVGERIGEWKDYYPNGQLSAVYTYTDGERNKESVNFFENSKVSHEVISINGKIFRKSYFESGNLQYESTLDDGVHKEFSESGMLLVESEYVANEPNGLWKKYYDTGELEWVLTYKDGYRDGAYKNFYKNGKVKLEGEMHNDVINGEENRYTENGQLEWTGKYLDNEFDSNWVKKDEKGKILAKLKFDNGVLRNSESQGTLQATIIPDGLMEKVPVFPGCEASLGNKIRRQCMSNYISSFISKKFNTNVTLKSGLTGKQRINVMFKIGTDGEVKDIKAIAPVIEWEEEAVRVVKLLPKMQPGLQRGIPVTVPYALPIVFQLQ